MKYLFLIFIVGCTPVLESRQPDSRCHIINVIREDGYVVELHERCGDKVKRIRVEEVRGCITDSECEGLE